MLHAMARNWWILAVRGIAAIAFGILAIVMPGITVVVLVSLFAAYAIIDGASALVMGFRAPNRNWWLVLLGVAGLAAGVITFLYPAMTALLLLSFVGAWAIVTGALQIGAAIRLRREIENEWWLALSGAISVLFGAYVLVFPSEGALAVLFVIGTFAIVNGIFLLLLAWKVRGLGTMQPG